MRFIIYLDDFTSEIFYELERLSEGYEGHKFEIEASDKKEATKKLLEKLQPFIENQFEEQKDLINGWKCPECGMVMNPSQSVCPNSPHIKTINNSTTIQNI